MKITVNEHRQIQLEKVYNSIILKSDSGEEMAICMRDNGFEFNYQDQWYSAQEGVVKKDLSTPTESIKETATVSNASN